MRSRVRFRDGFPPSDGIPGRHKEENMAVKISGGRDEMGWSAFRRSFNCSSDLISAWMVSSDALISASMACSRSSLESSRVGFIKTGIV